MKKIFATVAALLLFYSSVQANCDDDCTFTDENEFYVKVFGGANFIPNRTNGAVSNRYKTGYIVSGSLGYTWRYGLGLEAEYAFRRNSLKNIHFFGRTFSIDGHFQSSSYMANVLWHLPLENWGCYLWQLRPYIGGGIGVDVQQIHAKDLDFGFRDNKKGFAWQLMAGLEYPIFCNLNISLEYKFHKGPFSHIDNHSVGIGLSYYK